jgi:DNA-binding transcriptional MerR regulator
MAQRLPPKKSSLKAVDDETLRLKEIVERQLQRLLCQLKDLDELKADLTEEEIRETRSETMEELREFQSSLDRMIAGDTTLLDHLGAVRLATIAAINEAFKTPEIIRLFSNRQVELLRQTLAKLKEDFQLKKIERLSYEERAMEILTALKALNEPLSDEEAAFLAKQMNQRFNGFENTRRGSVNLSAEQEEKIAARFGNEAKQGS